MLRIVRRHRRQGRAACGRTARPVLRRCRAPGRSGHSAGARAFSIDVDGAPAAIQTRLSSARAASPCTSWPIRLSRVEKRGVREVLNLLETVRRSFDLRFARRPIQLRPRRRLQDGLGERHDTGRRRPCGPSFDRRRAGADTAPLPRRGQDPRLKAADRTPCRCRCAGCSRARPGRVGREPRAVQVCSAARRSFFCRLEDDVVY